MRQLPNCIQRGPARESTTQQYAIAPPLPFFFLKPRAPVVDLLLVIVLDLHHLVAGCKCPAEPLDLPVAGWFNTDCSSSAENAKAILGVVVGYPLDRPASTGLEIPAADSSDVHGPRGSNLRARSTNQWTSAPRSSVFLFIALLIREVFLREAPGLRLPHVLPSPRIR
jgi:hypothetical protein